MKLLAKTFESNPSILERSTKARRSEERAILRNETKLSDEQLEGWYIMALREPQKYLPKYDQELEEINNRLPNDEDDNEDDENEGKSETPIGGSPSSNQKSDPKKQSYKEKNKARFANHNRKNAALKKTNKIFSQH